ncbi:MAG TPA: MxaD family protein [Streptomyces sp.]|nr:MxaD family protein [Streptomyces sp.]
MARRLRHVDLAFADVAPLRLVFTTRLSAAPAAIHRALAEEVTDWPRWFGPLTLARPTGGGAGREVRLRGGARFRETVLTSESPERYAYRVDVTNAPGVRALLEDWRLTPAGTGTRVSWIVAVDGSRPTLLLLKAARPGLGRSFRGAMRSLDRLLGAIA